MEYKEIDQVPDFKPDIEEALLAKLSHDDPLKSVLLTTNITRQQVRWTCDTAVKAFNLSIQNERKLQHAQIWLVVLVVGALLAGVIKYLFTK